MVGSIMTEQSKPRSTKDILENTRLSPILTSQLADMNLLPKGIIGFDWDNTLHHGVTTLHKSCLDMAIFQPFRESITKDFMEDIKAGRYGTDGVEVEGYENWKRVGSLESIVNAISGVFLNRKLTPQEHLKFDTHQTANQCLPETQAQARMTQETYEYLRGLMAQYKVYILTNNREQILEAFVKETAIPELSQIGLPALSSMVMVAKDTPIYDSYRPNPLETAQETMDREKKREKPGTRGMTMAVARTMQAYKTKLETALKNDLDLQTICTKNNLKPADLIRYLLIRASHLDRLFVGDSVNSDGVVAHNMNKKMSIYDIDKTSSISPFTGYIKAVQKEDRLKKDLESYTQK